MQVISLQSGSNGNCIYVEAEGARLLFDAGISGLQVKRRLAFHGRDVTRVDAVVISHDHADHCRSMGILHRKFGLPIHVTAKTHKAAVRYGLGEIADVRHFRRGATLWFGKVAVETIPTPHDGVDGVVFVVDDGHRRLGILTDLEHVFSGLEDVCDHSTPCCWRATTIRKCWPRPLSRLAQGPYSRSGRPPLERRGRRTSPRERFGAFAMGLPGPFLRGQQHAESGDGHASADRRPASAAAGRHPARSHGCNRGVTMLGRLSENHVAE